MKQQSQQNLKDQPIRFRLLSTQKELQELKAYQARVAQRKQENELKEIEEEKKLQGQDQKYIKEMVKQGFDRN